MACTYNSVTLAEGDTFVLPPGATLIAASDIAALTSENDCLDTTNLEELKCYYIYIGESQDGSVDGHTAFMAYPDVTVTLGINGNEYTIGTGFPALSTVTSVVPTELSGIITFTSRNTNQWPNSPGWPTGPSRFGAFYHFTTIPSIANTVYFEVNGAMTDGSQPYRALPVEETCPGLG